MTLDLVPYEQSRLDLLILLWRDAFEFGVGVRDPHPLAEQREYFVSEVLPSNRVTLAMLDGRLVGFVASSTDSIAQLHVKVGMHRRGIGSSLLSLSKERSVGGLWLHTFARNVRACRFYEKHGFVAAERGFEPVWQLEDVKYRWVGRA